MNIQGIACVAFLLSRSMNSLQRDNFGSQRGDIETNRVPRQMEALGTRRNVGSSHESSQQSNTMPLNVCRHLETNATEGTLSIISKLKNEW